MRGGQSELTINRRYRKEEVDDAKAKRSSKSRHLWKIRVQENFRRIVCNDIDTAKLLHEHDDFRGDHRVPVSTNGKEFLQTALLANGHGFTFRLKPNMHVEEIPGGLESVMA